MQKRLEQEEKQSRGIILEVNDEVGLGTTANMILIDGTIKKGDFVVVAKRDSVVVIKPKALLLPKPLDEMRDPRDKFKPVDHVDAAAGIKIASPDLEGVLPGSTVYVTDDESKIEEFKKTIESEMKSVFIDTQTNGVILKCDTIGSLEAITEMLRRQQIPVAKADIGHINRRDVMEAKAIKENDRHLGVILAFNVRILPDAQEEADNYHIKIFNDQVIYSLIDNYTYWVDDDKANEENAVFSELTPICKFTFLKGYIFRNSNPAVFGIRVDAGTVKQKIQIMTSNGKKIGKIHQLQDGKKSIDTATQGQEVACSIQDVTIGRQISEEDVFYSMPNSREAKTILEKFLYKLSPEQQTVFNEIVALQRAKDASYGYV
jgi:translation initiation factor 5B